MFRFGRSGLELFNFSEGEVLFCDDVFVGFVFIILLLLFWKEVFVIEISCVSVWLFAFGVIVFSVWTSKFCCATPFCRFCFVMFVLINVNM